MNTIADKVREIISAPTPIAIVDKLQRAREQHQRFQELLRKGLVKKHEYNLPGRQELEQQFYIAQTQRSLD